MKIFTIALSTSFMISLFTYEAYAQAANGFDEVSPTKRLSQIIEKSGTLEYGQTRIVYSTGNRSEYHNLTTSLSSVSHVSRHYNKMTNNGLGSEETEHLNKVTLKAPSDSKIVRLVVSELFALYGKPNEVVGKQNQWLLYNKKQQPEETELVTISLTKTVDGSVEIISDTNVTVEN